MEIVKAKIVTAIAVLLAACQPSEPSARDTTAFDRPEIADNIHPDNATEWTLSCTNGQGLVATFDHPREMATVRRTDGLAFDLMKIPTSSGYRYQATETELQGVGKNATWSSPRISDTTCTVTEIKPLRHP